VKEFFLIVRSAALWIVSAAHFFPVGAFLVALGAFVDPRRNDLPQRIFFRNVLRLAGARLQVVRSPGFDPNRTSFFMCNHVSMFDAMIIYSAIPQFVRGLELESHFRIPVYGWMAKRFGNIPVPHSPKRSDVQAMKERCRAALDSGVSLIAFPEGTRTLTGRLGAFRPGVFRIARELGVPIVPMSVVGAFELKRKGHWMLRPATIVVHLHETIPSDGFTRHDEPELRRRVREIVNGPVAEWYGDEAPDG
jgi:1-acyl-sn-glycerol-3-phosphate acyltransferase